MSIFIFKHAQREKNKYRKKAAFHKSINSRNKRRKFTEVALYFRAIQHVSYKELTIL